MLAAEVSQRIPDIYVLSGFIALGFLFIIFIICKIRGRYKWRKKQIRIAGGQLTASFDDLLKQGFRQKFIRDTTIMSNGKDAYILIDFSDEEEKWCKIDSLDEREI